MLKYKNVTDVVFSSRLFHWMNPHDALLDVDRILKNGGVFAA